MSEKKYRFKNTDGSHIYTRLSDITANNGYSPYINEAGIGVWADPNDMEEVPQSITVYYNAYPNGMLGMMEHTRAALNAVTHFSKRIAVIKSTYYPNRDIWEFEVEKVTPDA